MERYTKMTASGTPLIITVYSDEEIKQKLVEFETKHGMTSQVFVDKWNKGELSDEKRDYVKWAGLCHTASNGRFKDLTIKRY